MVMDYNQAITYNSPGVIYGSQPTLPGQTNIVTAPQDWSGTGLGPIRTAGTSDADGMFTSPSERPVDPFAGFSQWAAMNGINPLTFRLSSPEDKLKIATAFKDSTALQKKVEPEPPSKPHGVPRSYMGRRLWQVNQTPQVKNLY